jgi:hypothetical protein
MDDSLRWMHGGWANDPLSLNRYSYVHNNPVNFIDPTGHWQEGDENLSEGAQEAILDLTDQYYGSFNVLFG